MPTAAHSGICWSTWKGWEDWEGGLGIIIMAWPRLEEQRLGLNHLATSLQKLTELEMVETVRVKKKNAAKWICHVSAALLMLTDHWLHDWWTQSQYKRCVPEVRPQEGSAPLCLHSFPRHSKWTESPCRWWWQYWLTSQCNKKWST